MDDPQHPPAPKNKGGRPRVVERGVIVSAWLPSSDYDKIIQIANKHDVSVSKLVRVWVRQQLR